MSIPLQLTFISELVRRPEELTSANPYSQVFTVASLISLNVS